MDARRADARDARADPRVGRRRARAPRRRPPRSAPDTQARPRRPDVGRWRTTARRARGRRPRGAGARDGRAGGGGEGARVGLERDAARRLGVRRRRRRRGRAAARLGAELVLAAAAVGRRARRDGAPPRRRLPYRRSRRACSGQVRGARRGAGGRRLRLFDNYFERYAQTCPSASTATRRRVRRWDLARRAGDRLLRLAAVCDVDDRRRDVDRAARAQSPGFAKDIWSEELEAEVARIHNYFPTRGG